MFITGCGTAVPPNRYTQKQCWEAVRGSEEFDKLSARSQAILRKVFLGDNGIDSRHLALQRLEDAFRLEPDVLHARFLAAAPALAAEAATRALKDSRIDPQMVDGLIISTCTGYLCPGLTSYAAERLKLRPDVLALDLVGQGCGAAIPNLSMAKALLESQRCERVVSVCVEVCSAAFYLDDDPGVLISACLFGDGAAAVTLERNPSGHGRSLEWLGSQSFLDPTVRDRLRFEQRKGMLRNILDKNVPELLKAPLQKIWEECARAHHITPSDIRAWLLHAGGRTVLEAARECLRLVEDDLQLSAQVLRQFGNVSSPSVLFALQAALLENYPPGFWWMSSFGAGFSCHGAMLRAG